MALGWEVLVPQSSISLIFFSFFFCQELVEARVLAAGYLVSDLVRDRHVAPEIDTKAAVAVYVDGVAVFRASGHDGPEHWRGRNSFFVEAVFSVDVFADAFARRFGRRRFGSFVQHTA